MGLVPRAGVGLLNFIPNWVFSVRPETENFDMTFSNPIIYTGLLTKYTFPEPCPSFRNRVHIRCVTNSVQYLFNFQINLFGFAITKVFIDVFK